MGIFKKASLVGANTVNVPGPDRVSTRPAAFTAAKRVLNLGSPTTISAILLEGIYDSCVVQHWHTQLTELRPVGWMVVHACW